MVKKRGGAAGGGSREHPYPAEATVKRLYANAWTRAVARAGIEAEHVLTDRGGTCARRGRGAAVG